MAIQSVHRLQAQVLISQRREAANDGVRQACFNAFDPKCGREQYFHAHIAKLEKVPGPFVGGEGENGLHENKAVHFQQLGDLCGHHPGHGKMFEAGGGIDDVKLLPGEIGGELMDISYHIHISARVKVKANVFGLGERLPCAGCARYFTAADLEDPDAWFVADVVQNTAASFCD